MRRPIECAVACCVVLVLAAGLLVGCHSEPTTAEDHNTALGGPTSTGTSGGPAPSSAGTTDGAAGTSR